MTHIETIEELLNHEEWLITEVKFTSSSFKGRLWYVENQKGDCEFALEDSKGNLQWTTWEHLLTYLY